MDDVSPLTLVKMAYYSGGMFEDRTAVDKFPKEEVDALAYRRGKVAYENILRPEVDSQVTPAFTKPAVRTVGELPITEAEGTIANATYKDITRTGVPIEKFTEKVLNEAQWSGYNFVIVCTKERTPASKLDLAVRANLPYAMKVRAEDVGEEYLLDSLGGLKQIKYVEDYDAEGDPIYRVWDKHDDDTAAAWREDKDGEIISDSRVDLEGFPVTAIESNDRYDETRLPKSRYITVAQMSHLRMNILSYTIEGFYKTCFALLGIPTDGDINELISSAGNAIKVPLESTNMPAYITPAVDHLRVMIEEYLELKKSIQEELNSTLFIASNSSEQARVQADKRRIEALKMTAIRAEDLEEWIYNVAFPVWTRKNEEYDVQYDKTFQSLTIDLFIEQWRSILELAPEIMPDAFKLKVIEKIVEAAAYEDKAFQDELKSALNSEFCTEKPGDKVNPAPDDEK
jgi:hypothetical protein